MQVAHSPSGVIEWCCQCGALRSLAGSQTWMRSNIADNVVALAIAAVEVA